MDNLYIVRGVKTPQIDFNVKGELRIEGRCFPENPVEFYQKSFEWLNMFVESMPMEVNLHVNLENFNTSSSKVLFHIFKLFEPLHMRGSKVNLYWYYEDDTDMLEAGQDYAEILKFPFHFVKLPQ
jgi:SiaC family regulatory phosphoprotein